MRLQTTILAILLFASTSVLSQQLPVNNQYLVNKYSISPAYAGYNDNIEGFLSYRKNWVGVKGAPENESIFINGPVTQKRMGVGFAAQHEQTGNYNHYRLNGTYAYHFEFSKSMSVSMGLSAQLYKNQLDVSSIKSQGLDPLLANKDVLTGTTFDATFGVMFNISNINVGFVVPQLMGSKLKYDGSQYALTRHYVAHVSYLYEMGKTIKIEPSLVVKMTQNAALTYEAAIFADYQDKIWAGFTYRKPGNLCLSVGSALNERIALLYTYEFGSKGIVGLSSGSHEVTIGFLIQSSKNKSRPPSIFKFIEAGSSGGGPSVDTKKLEEKIVKLEEKIKTCCEQKPTADNSKEIAEINERLKKLENKQTANEIDQYEPPFIFNNIKFATNSDVLFSSSYPELNKYVEKMNKNKDLEIKIIGYTDNVGSARYNLRLSEKRAIAIKKYFTDQGIVESRIMTEGKGQENPIVDNETEEGRQQNRRIEGMFKKLK